MTAEQILDEIMLLPAPERQRVVVSVRNLEAGDIPEDFPEELDDFVWPVTARARRISV